MSKQATEKELQQINDLKQGYRNQINNNPLTSYISLTKSKSGGYVCPICGSGTGRNHTGALMIKNNRITCFANGCFGDPKGSANGSDTLGALMKLENENEYNILKKYANFDFTEQLDSLRAGTPKEAPKVEVKVEQQPEIKADFTTFILQAKEDLKKNSEAMKYLTDRGLTPETIERFNLGYYEKYNTPRISIPYNGANTYYIGRRLDKDTNIKYEKPNSDIAGTEPLFNGIALKSQEPIFIVEGIFCALSIMQAGGVAVALNTTGDPVSFNKSLKKYKDQFKSCFIVCLDNDEPGKAGQQKLTSFLQDQKVLYTEYNISGTCKDPNELLQSDPELFKSNVNTAIMEAKKRLYDDMKPDNVELYLDTLFKSDIESFKESKDRKTGFKQLDELAGGLYPGLYVVGAISSLGKTTFIHQMADQLATAGEDVLFFSLEQSRLEMVSKSLARITAQKDINNALTSLKIRDGITNSILLQAIQEYRNSVKDRISVIEGNFNCNVPFIKEYVENYLKKTNTRPVIIVDYLQILQGDPEQKQSAKELIDSNVTELKRLSRDLDLTVIVISSLNRSNYLSQVDFESFKESGGIEYTADVIWGLQLQAINDEIFNKNESINKKREKIREAKASNPRKLELVCLKNRYGISSYKTPFIYYPQYDLFCEENAFNPIMDKDNPFIQQKPGKVR